MYTEGALTWLSHRYQWSSAGQTEKQRPTELSLYYETILCKIASISSHYLGLEKPEKSLLNGVEGGLMATLNF